MKTKGGPYGPPDIFIARRVAVELQALPEFLLVYTEPAEGVCHDVTVNIPAWPMPRESVHLASGAIQLVFTALRVGDFDTEVAQAMQELAEFKNASFRHVQEPSGWTRSRVERRLVGRSGLCLQRGHQGTGAHIAQIPLQ